MKNLNIRLTNLGLSKQFMGISENLSDSPFYMAPQLFKGDKYTEAADAWAVGVVILQLWLNGKIAKFMNNCYPALADDFPKK